MFKCWMFIGHSGTRLSKNVFPNVFAHQQVWWKWWGEERQTPSQPSLPPRSPSERCMLVLNNVGMFMFKDITPRPKRQDMVQNILWSIEISSQVPYQSIDATTSPRQIRVWVSDGYCQRASYYTTEIGQNWYMRAFLGDQRHLSRQGQEQNLFTHIKTPKRVEK